MKKVAIIGCGAYMNSGYGCPGEWRCLKAAAVGEGKFDAVNWFAAKQVVTVIPIHKIISIRMAPSLVNADFEQILCMFHPLPFFAFPSKAFSFQTNASRRRI